MLHKRLPSLCVVLLVSAAFLGAQGSRIDDAALRKAGRAGRLPRLSEKQRQQLEKLLVAGPERIGYETPLWTCPRVADLIEQEFQVRYHEGHVWKILVGLGWSPQRPEGRARERNEEQVRQWKKQVWPGLKKKR